MGTLFTIGHSNHSLENFMKILLDNNIHYVLDVRSNPHARFVPHFNEKQLSHYLNSINVNYANMGKYFGARQTQKEYYSQEGYLDFELFRESDVFQIGLNTTLKLLEKSNVLLLCMERDPIDCHRAIMVGRGFELSRIKVNHILFDSTIITQDELNHRLLDKYFPARDQLSLFSNQEKDSELLINAYRNRNKEIGYYKK